MELAQNRRNEMSFLVLPKCLFGGACLGLLHVFFPHRIALSVYPSKSQVFGRS